MAEIKLIHLHFPNDFLVRTGTVQQNIQILLCSDTNPIYGKISMGNFEFFCFVLFCKTKNSLNACFSMHILHSQHMPCIFWWNLCILKHSGYETLGKLALVKASSKKIKIKKRPLILLASIYHAEKGTLLHALEGNQPNNNTTFNLFVSFFLSANLPSGSRPQVRVHGFVNKNSNRNQKRLLFTYDVQIRDIALSMNQRHRDGQSD